MIATIDSIQPRISGPGTQGPDAGPPAAPAVRPGPVGPATNVPPSGVTGAPAGASFRDALTAAAGERSVQLSGHALRRLEQRQIPLQSEQLDRLQKAMDTLSQRGSRQSVVLLDQVAYVVDVPSHTVVTAVQPDRSKESVFTQIDSVVIA